jgi:hypothetical protein
MPAMDPGAIVLEWRLRDFFNASLTHPLTMVGTSFVIAVSQRTSPYPAPERRAFPHRVRRTLIRSPGLTGLVNLSPSIP